MRVLGCQTLVRNESKGNLWLLRWDGETRHHRPIMILRKKDLSLSISVGTRKMVNYACVG